MNLILTTLASFIGASGAIFLAIIFLKASWTKVLGKDSEGNPTIVEETKEQADAFDSDSRAIIDYCLKRNLNITIQPNFESVMWIFHHTESGELYSICPMIPGTLSQMINKIDNYVIHKDQHQEELKKNAKD